ncbi:CbtA family protein [Halalkalicoccus sp. NIPERK01]|uniref:CbtA family protein n=1 Tax=Halalkalicoccus sp. NIPERK01 TaxID=3053469 RepID=UPI00256F4DA7|nr:CbtA family protein [Halalkalicoccus sp. NIPERK01]MDL5363112.1 CbtA family protein [Halalkalicoccus sp. NIPERK01]
MLATHLKRGVKAGVVAGLVFGLFMALVANPLVAFADELGHERGHAVGEHHEHAAGEHHEDHGGEHHDSAVSMTVTNGVSVVSGVLWGVLLGGVVFGIAYYFLEPAIPGTGGAKSYLLAAAGFVTVSGAPWLVLPPQPPGVAQTLPTETRLALYGGMMVVGAVVCLLAGFAYGRLRGAHGRITAAGIAVLPFGLLAIPVVLAPSNPVESTLPPELATGLIGITVFGQAMLWLLLAGIHARFRRPSKDDRAAETVPTPTETTVTGD